MLEHAIYKSITEHQAKQLFSEGTKIFVRFEHKKKDIKNDNKLYLFDNRRPFHLNLSKYQMKYFPHYVFAYYHTDNNNFFEYLEEKRKPKQGVLQL